MKQNNLRGFFTRYLILILVALPNLAIFYLVFTPLTIYPVYFLLNIFFDANISGNLILLNGKHLIEIIKACVIGSAYYLLLILNLTTPGIKIKKRLMIIGVSFGALLIANILRIFFLSILFASQFSLLNLIHKIFWYFGSIILVIIIWFAIVKTFNIKETPIYSDMKFLLNNIKSKK